MSEYCNSWADDGKCESRKDYMYHNCPDSCGLCGQDEGETKPNCEDTSEWEFVLHKYKYLNCYLKTWQSSIL